MRVAAACLAPYEGYAMRGSAANDLVASVRCQARCRREREHGGTIGALSRSRRQRARHRQAPPGTARHQKWRGPAEKPNPATGHRRAPEGCCSSRWGSLHRAPLVPCPYPEVRQPLVASGSTLFAHARPSLLGHTRCSGVAIARRAVGPDRDSASMSKGPSVPSTGSTGAGNWPRVTRHFPSVGTRGTRPALDRARAHNPFSPRILGRANAHTQ